MTTDLNSSVPASRLRHLSIVALVLAVACVIAAIFSGLGYRLGLWHFRTGFAILRWSAYLALVAAALSIVGLIALRGRSGPGLVAGLVALALAAVTAYMPWHQKRIADRVPRIHDISTDLENPPAFVAVARVRTSEDHAVTYDGPEVAAQQREAYPDLAPLIAHASKEKVFESAKAAVSAMGLELIEAVPAEGRIEATDTTLWYGFKDDLVVRVSEAPDGTRVDVRSKSRVGRSDVGVNARRIRDFLQKLDAALASA